MRYTSSFFRKAAARCEQAVEHAFAEALRQSRGDAMAEHLLHQAVAGRHAAGDGEMGAYSTKDVAS